MQIVNVRQGSTEWHAIRAENRTASEAPVMMGSTAKMKRDELLDMKKYGSEKEISTYVQKFLFDKGHEMEAAIRPHIEKLIDDDLFPITATEVIDGIPMLASSDGCTMCHTINFEHKMWNEDLAQAVRDKDIPLEYCWQMEEQMMVLGCEKTIFVVSDGTPDNMEYMWYSPVEGRREALIAGWHQFEKDLVDYIPANDPAPAVGKIVESLPVLQVNVTGSVISTNVPAFQEAADKFLAYINKDLDSDQDFADAENIIKVCTEAESQIKAVEKLTIDQMADVSTAIRSVKAIGEQVRQTRLDLEKLVANKKAEIRQTIIGEASVKLDTHIKALTDEFDFNVNIPHSANFVGVIKNKRTKESLRNAVNSELARVKIEVDAIAKKMRHNVKFIDDQEDDYWFLFHDVGFTCLKETEDFELLVKSRVADHKEKLEKKKLEEAKSPQKVKQDEHLSGARDAISDAESSAMVSSAQLGAAPTEEDRIRLYANNIEAAIQNNVPDIEDEKLKKYIMTRRTRMLSMVDEIVAKLPDQEKVA